MEQFTARMYSKHADEAQIARLSVEPGTLVVESSDGTSRLDLNSFDLQLAGDNEDRVKLEHVSSGTVFLVSQPEILDELEKHGGSTGLLDVVKKNKKKLRSGPLRRWGVLFGVLGSIALVIVIFYATFDFWVDLAVDKIPPDAESVIGSALIDKNKIDDKSAQAKRIKKIGESLVSHVGTTPYEFEFFVEKNDVVNAYALPGGKIVVYSKLIDEASSDDEIAGILGHEIGHVIHRDSLHRAIHGSGMTICLALLFGGAVNNQQLMALLPALRSVESLSYSRSAESAADREGVRLAYESGYDPEAQIAFFERLAKSYDSLGDAGKAVFSVVSDHPMPADRINQIKKETAALKAKSKQNVPAEKRDVK